MHAGSLLAGGDWTIVPTIDQATGQIAIALSSSTPISSSIGGSLVTIDFHFEGVRGQGSGVSADASRLGLIRLVTSATPHGQLVTTELEDAQGAFTLTMGTTNSTNPTNPTEIVAEQISVAPEHGPGLVVVQGADRPFEADLADAAVVSEASTSGEGTGPAVLAAPATLQVGAAVGHEAASMVAITTSLITSGVPPLNAVVAPYMAEAQARDTSLTLRVSKLTDQFFQALGRVADNTEWLSWDEPGPDLVWQKQGEWSRDVAAVSQLAPAWSASEEVTDHSSLDHVFAWDTDCSEP